MGWPKGKHFSKSHRKKISKAMKGGNKTSFKKGIHSSPQTEFKKGTHPSPKTEFKKGQIPWNWKNGRRITTRGYILIFKPNHPFAQKSTGLIMEHRLVMEKHLGRYLKKREVVHHKNNNFSDNRIENLILFNNHSEHISFHEHHHNRLGQFV